MIASFTKIFAYHGGHDHSVSVEEARGTYSNLKQVVVFDEDKMMGHEINERGWKKL